MCDDRGGALKVSKGAMIVMRDTILNNLYFLQRSTVIGIATTVCYDIGEDASDTTRLWHMRLGNAREKTMQGLVEQNLLKGA